MQPRHSEGAPAVLEPHPLAGGERWDVGGIGDGLERQTHDQGGSGMWSMPATIGAAAGVCYLQNCANFF